MGTDPDITALLVRARGGDRHGQSRLFEVVYNELRRMASAELRHERHDHTLQATALVHEAYLRLLGREDVPWENRAHFFTTAAGTMRRILVDYARAHRAKKRDGALERIDLDFDRQPALAPDDFDRVLWLDAALSRLAALDPPLAQLVELRAFGGLTVDETAETLRMSPSTVDRNWTFAKAWLKTELEGNPDGRG
jgi:RNA polymerase sigma factor (TIGR02999 family)